MTTVEPSANEIILFENPSTLTFTGAYQARLNKLTEVERNGFPKDVLVDGHIIVQRGQISQSAEGIRINYGPSRITMQPEQIRYIFTAEGKLLWVNRNWLTTFPQTWILN